MSHYDSQHLQYTYINIYVIYTWLIQSPSRGKTKDPFFTMELCQKPPFTFFKQKQLNLVVLYQYICLVFACVSKKWVQISRPFSSQKTIRLWSNRVGFWKKLSMNFQFTISFFIWKIHGKRYHNYCANSIKKILTRKHSMYVFIEFKTGN